MTTEIGIYDHATGENVVRPMTKDELADYKAGLAQTAASEAAALQAEKDKATAQSKLEALGLTADDLKALGL